MRKFTHAILAFQNKEYVSSYKGYDNEEIAVTKCNELNKYANDLLAYNTAFEECKNSNEELLSLYEERTAIWREYNRLFPKEWLFSSMQTELDTKFDDLLERIKSLDTDLRATWEENNPFHSTREDKNGSVFNVITIEVETETFVQKLLNFFKNKS